jgi:hypothetical protein
MHESQLTQLLTKPRRPGSGRLLQSIDCFLKFTDMMRPRRINKTGRLLHIDAFIKIAMKQGIADVDLKNILAARHGY